MLVELVGMSFSPADERSIYTYKVTNITSLRLFVLVAFCLFVISRYVSKAVKYRVWSYNM